MLFHGLIRADRDGNPLFYGLGITHRIIDRGIIRGCRLFQAV